MKRRPRRQTIRRSRTGGVYPLVLIVAGAAASASLAGLAMRRAVADRQAMSADLAQARIVARSALESAVAVIAETSSWRSKWGVDESWAGTIGPHTYTVSVTDETDGDLSDAPDDPFVVTATGTVGDARATARAEVGLPPDTEYRARALALGPVSYWPLDDESGTFTAARLAGDQDGGYSTTVVSARETGFDERPAPRFDTTGTLAYIPHHDALLLDEGTLMCHFLVDQDRFLADQTVLAKDIRGTNGSGSIRLYFTDPGLTLRVRLESRDETIDKGVTTVDTDAWHHVAVTFGRKGLAVCLNGQRVFHESAFTTGLGPAAGNSGNTHTLTAGVWYDGDSFEDPLMGSVRDIIILDRQLSPRQIDQLVNPKRGSLWIRPNAWRWVTR